MERRLGDGPDSQIVTARFLLAGSSDSCFAEAQRAALNTPAFGQPVFHLRDLNAVVWAFPNDPVLTGVHALTDEERITREVAPSAVSQILGREVPVRQVTVETVQYVPERGYTVKATALTGDGQPVVFYGKTCPDVTGKLTYGRMCELWESERRRSGAFRMAQPLAYEPRHIALWQAAVEGPTLDTLRGPAAQFPPLFELAGRSIAALHQTPVSGLRRMTVADLRRRLLDTERLLREVKPLAGRFSSLVARLLEESGNPGSRPIATLHGDLAGQNLVLSTDGAVLIDFDNACAGDPLMDLGSFLSTTCSGRMMRRMPPSDLASILQAVIAGYERNVPWDVPCAALRWYIAEHLISVRARRTVVRYRGISLEEILELAESTLAGTGVMQTLATGLAAPTHP